MVEPETAEKPSYTGPQSGAVVEPETHASLPEYKGEQSGAIIAPETTETPEYRGTQAGAIVAPETADKPEYTGTQSGAIVEPETRASLPEYKGKTYNRHHLLLRMHRDDYEPPCYQLVPKKCCIAGFEFSKSAIVEAFPSV